MDEVFIIQGAGANDKSADVLLAYQGNDFHELTDLGPELVRVVRKVAQWTDPFTLPHSKLVCVKECHITKWDKWCCGWAVKRQTMEVELFLEVRTAVSNDIVSALEGCLREAAISAGLAAIVVAVFTGGAAIVAAEAAFIAVLTPCLEKKLNDILSIKLYATPYWSDWK